MVPYFIIIINIHLHLTATLGPFFVGAISHVSNFTTAMGSLSSFVGLALISQVLLIYIESRKRKLKESSLDVEIAVMGKDTFQN